MSEIEEVFLKSQNIITLPNNETIAMVYKTNNSMLIDWSKTDLPYPNIILFGGNEVAKKIITDVLKKFKPNSELLIIGDNNTLLNGRTSSFIEKYSFTTCIKINNFYFKLVFNSEYFYIHKINSNDIDYKFLISYDKEEIIYNFTNKINFYRNNDYNEQVEEITNVLINICFQDMTL
jgi:hypothetical protein